MLNSITNVTYFIHAVIMALIFAHIFDVKILTIQRDSNLYLKVAAFQNCPKQKNISALKAVTPGLCSVLRNQVNNNNTYTGTLNRVNAL